MNCANAFDTYHYCQKEEKGGRRRRRRRRRRKRRRKRKRRSVQEVKPGSNGEPKSFFEK